jgi:preprotein translocase subunit YajC
MVLGNWLVLATATASEGAASGKGLGGGWEMLILFLILGAIFYFMVIKPQQNQKKAHQAMISKLKAGDKVVTIGGMHGYVHTVKRGTVLLKVDEKVRVEMSLGSIATVVAAAAEGADVKDDDKARNDDKSKK